MKRNAAWVSMAMVALGMVTASPAAAGRGLEGRQEHDRIVARLRAVAHQGDSFGPVYARLYRVILPWYEKWGGRNNVVVDDWAVAPDIYAAELADALEHGRNYIAEHPASSFPALFERKLAGGQSVMENYQLHLPAGFPDSARRYPLFIGLPGSGWIAHKISYSRGSENRDAWISVTPILEGRDWQIRFLNDYLDELIKLLPVDVDKVYASGHSLGAMATWNWATSFPDRFAAIFPEDGFGQPYRAVRLKNVPVWAIHGEKDDTILPGLAEEMVSAVRAVGGTAIYSRLKGAPHNIPAWFNSEPVVDWCLQHVRSHRAPPADPRSSLGLNKDGFSPWSIEQFPAEMVWKSAPQSLERVPARAGGVAVAGLFAKAEADGAIVDGPVRYEIDPTGHTTTPLLGVPLALRPSSNNDPAIVKLSARRAVRFYFSGTPDQAAAHLKDIQAALPSKHGLSYKFLLTPLGPVADNSRTQVFECRCDLN
jgi:hypothetical protein